MSDNLAERLRRYLDADGYEPQDARSMARALGLSSSAEQKQLRALLQAACVRGELLRLAKGLYARRRPRGGSLTGRVRRLANGKLLLPPNAAGLAELRRLCPAWEGDAIPIPPGRALDAADGDTVRATLRLHRPAAHGRRGARRAAAPEDLLPQLRVEEVLRRGHDYWVGTFCPGGRCGFLLGDGQTAPERVRLTTPAPEGLAAGTCIAVRPVRYPIGHTEAAGELVELLGDPQRASVRVSAVIRRYGLPEGFPEEVLREAAAIPAAVRAEELTGRDDWRERCVLTIDPEGARDYDDAIALQRSGEGWELAVHIADVSHYVAPGSALDAEAQRRGNSTYLPDRVLPMLPPALCDGICSLRQGEDRLTLLCLMRLNRQGKLIRSELREAVIRSRRRLTYAQALAVLEGRGSTGDAECDALLREAQRLAQLLRRRRMEGGALDLDLPELRLLTDAAGQPCDVELSESDEAHRLIEEFMLAANECVARALREHCLPALYRVHEEPDPAKLQQFLLRLRSSGIPAPAGDDRRALQGVLLSIRGRSDENDLKTELLRCLMRARYSPRPLGHYGLAKGDYCHFTSPIRRYADLVVHRACRRLMRAVGAPSLPRPESAESLAEHLSDTERQSAAAESEAERQLLSLYMEQQCRADEPRRWSGRVTACWAQGLVVEIPLQRLKGFVPAADLPQDTRWFYERHAERWSALDARVLLPGSPLTLIPRRVDAATGFVDFIPV